VSLLLASVVDGEALVEMLWTATVAGLGVTCAFGLTIAGMTRAADARRDGRHGEAVVLGIVGLVALAAVAAAVVFAIIVMTTK